MNPICFYHSRDLDGVCSGAIVKHFVPDCEMYGIDYADLFPWASLLPQGACPDIIAGPESVVLFELSRLLEKGLCKPRTVYMVDFSLPYEDMKRLAEVSNLIWIDHHASCEALWNEINPLGMFRTSLAACELTWEWVSLHAQGGHGARRLTEELKTCLWREICPEAVKLLGRYDVFERSNPLWEARILPFQYGMRVLENIYDPTCPRWEGVLNGGLDVNLYVQLGNAVLSYIEQQNRLDCTRGAYEMVLTLPDPELQPRVVKGADGVERLVQPSGLKFDVKTGKRIPNNVMPSYRCVCCNTTVSNSQFFASVYDPKQHDVMISYNRLAGGLWRVSFYHDNPDSDIDCGLIAKAFGGGGHKGAAGCVMKYEDMPWRVR